MAHWICVTCGTQFAESVEVPAHCPICEDERQYIGHKGQQWTTLAEMQQGGFHNEIVEVEPRLTSIQTKPSFAIGQRGLLIQTPRGNVLWDCLTLLDDATIEAVQKLGGIQAIAISHPHYYSTMAEWASAFGARVYLPEADRGWVMRPHERIEFWRGDTLELQDGITLIRTGGHFAGSMVLHWRDGMAGQGALLTGDTIQVVADRTRVTFMYSYPNSLPLPAATVRRIWQRVEPYQFERIYGAWPERVVAHDAKGAVRRSAELYVRSLEEELSLNNLGPSGVVKQA
ncbi:MAG: MBL fold metallo-hydrolase [Ktedonobacteraceae bacterium]|nr:MBL fold metallo-hydrolase [Ktedonobacteraceae bacterium]